MLRVYAKNIIDGDLPGKLFPDPSILRYRYAQARQPDESEVTSTPRERSFPSWVWSIGSGRIQVDEIIVPAV